MERRRRTEKVKKKKKRSKKKIILISVLLILLSVIGYFAYTQIIVPQRAGSRPLSILLVGSDINSYREVQKGGTKPEKTDSLMVLTFNPQTFRFVVSSIPRDTAIDYKCGEIRGKVNEIYPATEGSNSHKMDCLEQSIEDYLNVPIDRYVKVNMDQIVDVIDKFGNIEIKVHAADGYLEQINVDGTQTYAWTDGETVTMGADEALTYARARHDSEKDYGRGIRQQQVMVAVLKNMLDQGISMDVINSVLSMVDTNMEPALALKYYKYVKELQTINTKIENKEYLTLTDVSDETAISMMKYFGEKQSEVPTEKEFQSFQKELISNKSTKDIKKYFFESHQLYNDGYNGYYVTPQDQMKEVSNALRSNLGLDNQTPKEPSKPFGTNTFEKETTVTQAAETYSDTSYYTDEEETDTTTSAETNTTTNNNTEVEESDSDGDGIVDSKDEYPNGEDEIDTDGDGIPDVEDDTPNGDDADGDGILDKDEDTDGDGIPDVEDKNPEDPTLG